MSHVYMGIRNEIISSRNLVTFNFYFYVDNSTKKILELVSHVYMEIMCVNYSGFLILAKPFFRSKF